MNAAIYARVSTDDQKCEMQLTELHALAARHGWAATDYTEHASGKAGSRRPVLERLLADARWRKFDVVIVWKLDRFGRSVADLVNHIQTLDRLGIRFISATQGLDTDQKNPTGRLLLHILASVAEFERSIIVERVTAGLREYQRAYAAGQVGTLKHSRSGADKPIGRPKRVFDRGQVNRYRRKGWSWRRIAKQMSLPLTTIRPRPSDPQQGPKTGVRKPVPLAA